jgi:purine-binding chemotaxis protein CheW
MNGQRQIDWNDVRRRLARQQEALERNQAVDSDRLAQVCAQRARNLAARSEQNAAQDDSWQALVFVVRGEKYCLPVAALAQVLPLAGCSPVPGAPPAMLGVINVRGEIRSVFDLARLLEIPGERDSSRGYVVLVRSGEHEVGLAVDAVHWIERVLPARLIAIDSPATIARPVRQRTPSRITVLAVDEILALIERSETTP